MLTVEKIGKNAKRYFASLEKYVGPVDALLDALGGEFVSAPASTKTETYCAFDGGLIDHLLRVAKYAVNLNSIYPENMKVDEKSLLKVALLHQIGKAKLFKHIESDWHRERGILYEYDNDNITMRVSERTLFYLSEASIKLTEEEHAAILNYDKGDDDKQSRFYNSMLGETLKMANILAIKESKLKYQ